MTTVAHVLSLVVVAICLVVEPPTRIPLYAASFYLSPSGSDSTGTGSRQTPWRTLQHATSRIPDDGSTLVLLDGRYEESQAVARQFRNICTVKAEHPYRARLGGGPRQNRALTCYSAANVIFQGLEIAGSGATQGEYMVHISTPRTHHLVFEDCIVHDCYDNDMVKINDFTHHILFRNCVFYNQTDGGGFQHFDINTCTDVCLEGSIFFNDYAGSGRPSANRSQGFIVAKNSGSTPDVTRRIFLGRNIFLNWDGKPDMAFILLGEDGKPFCEAQQVLIENNLFLHNSPVRSWGTLLYKGGLRDITFRANTVSGHPAVKWTGAESAVCLRIEQNPPMDGLTFVNNIFSDPTGQMPRFSISGKETFAPGSRQVLLNNLYWNAGKPIPTETKDVLTPDRDTKKIMADPQLRNPGKGVTLPRWNAKKGAFLSGQKTIGGEFQRLVKLYAVPAAGSPAGGAADPAAMPKDDILGNPRGEKPDVGCYQRQAEE